MHVCVCFCVCVSLLRSFYCISLSCCCSAVHHAQTFGFHNPFQLGSIVWNFHLNFHLGLEFPDHISTGGRSFCCVDCHRGLHLFWVRFPAFPLHEDCSLAQEYQTHSRMCAYLRTCVPVFVSAITPTHTHVYIDVYLSNHVHENMHVEMCKCTQIRTRAHVLCQKWK